MKYISILFALILSHYALADGMSPYNPKVGEWVELQLNSNAKTERKEYMTMFKFQPPKTILILVGYNPKEKAGVIDGAIEKAKAHVKLIAAHYSFTDLEIKIERRPF